MPRQNQYAGELVQLGSGCMGRWAREASRQLSCRCWKCVLGLLEKARSQQAPPRHNIPPDHSSIDDRPEEYMMKNSSAHEPADFQLHLLRLGFHLLRLIHLLPASLLLLLRRFCRVHSCATAKIHFLSVKIHFLT